jgi:hypothetical protein
MTKFNPDNKQTLTYGETLGPAMKITEQEDADQYLKAYTAHIQTIMDRETEPNPNPAEQVAKTNLGYYSGYYDNETMIRVQRLFRCSHPIFGSASEGVPSAEEAFAMGVKAGEGKA